MTKDKDPKAPVAPLTDAEKTASHLSIEELRQQADPKPTSDQSLAGEIAAEIAAEEEAKRKKELELRNAGALYYLHCPGCEAPALFFSREPRLGQLLDHREWFSELKPLGRPWHAGKVRCQKCNQPVRAQYTKGQQTMKPTERFVRAIDPTNKPRIQKLVAELARFRQSMQIGGVK